MHFFKLYIIYVHNIIIPCIIKYFLLKLFERYFKLHQVYKLLLD